MRPLVSAASIALLGLGSYWLLTNGFGPKSETVASSSSVVETTNDVLVVGRSPASPAGGGASAAPSHPHRQALKPTVRTDLVTVSYDVEGATPAEILQSLVERGPSADGETFFGLTEASVDLQYDTVPAEVGCTIGHVAVVLHLTVTMPDWTVAAGTDPALGRDWSRFRRALAAHEGGHRAIAEDGANALLDAVHDLHRTTCNGVHEEANQRLERIQADIEAAHQRYDTETDHGLTEGAIWPIPR